MANQDRSNPELEEVKSQMKVLLIGLGGTGCKVVSRVKRMVEQNRKNEAGKPETRIEFLGFDTDTNQKEAPGLTIIRTSREAQVFELLQNEHDWRTWFPDSNMLLARNMNKGAGQKRLLSRLAFSDTLRHRASLKPLEEAMRRLNTSNGLVNSGLKVMIVSSFAGGTGAGMFLQFPLFLRQWIRDNYTSVEQVMIRGLFALPDVFRSAVSTDDQIKWESMLANAYASMRELAAVNKVCVSDDPTMKNYDITIDGLFDSKSLLKRREQEQRTRGNPRTVPAARKPYDFIFFIDDLNSNRNQLSFNEEYYQQMAEITYVQVYSPAAPGTDSDEDNLIETQMELDGEAMYGSAGASRLVYPYDDVLENLSIQYATGLIRERWAAFDKYFRDSLKDAQARRKSDRSVSLPDRGQTFVEQMDRFLEDSNSHYDFLRDAFYREESEKDENGVETGITLHVSLLDEYYMSINSYIEETLKKDLQLKNASEACIFDFDKDSDLRIQVGNTENALAEYERIIKKRTDSLFLALANSILPESLSSTFDDPDKPYSIHTLLERDSEDSSGRQGLHPLAVRYLLYRLRAMISKDLTASTKTRKEKAAAIEKYNKEDRDPNTTDVKEKFYDIFPEKDVPLFKPLTKRFMTKFLSEGKKHKKNLDTYCQARLYSAVYSQLLSRLNALIEQYEQFFDLLDRITANLNERLVHLNDKYGSDLQNPNETYICASPAYIREISRHTISSDEESCSDSVFIDMFAAMHANGMQKLIDERNYGSDAAAAEDSTAASETMISLFDSRIYPMMKKKVERDRKDDLEMDLYDALEREIVFRLTGHIDQQVSQADRDQKRRDIINEVYVKASPYLANKDRHGAISQALIWGVNDAVAKKVEKRYNPIISYFQANAAIGKVIPHYMYDKREVACYRAVYSITLPEIPDFQESDVAEEQGKFYKSYLSRIRKMMIGRHKKTDEGLTPHLDIRWHTRQYLPPIDAEKLADEDSKIARAMWLAYLYDCIDDVFNSAASEERACVIFRKRNIDAHADTTVPQEDNYELVWNGRYTRAGRVYDVFKSLQQNSVVWSWILENLEPVLAYHSDITLPGNRDFVGTNANELAVAMIGGKSLTAAGTDPEKEVDEDVLENENILVLMARVARHQRASDYEYRVILQAMLKLIDEFTENMTVNRKNELLMRIFANSPYTAKQKRKERVWRDLEPYFKAVVEEYDGRVKSSKTTTAVSKPAAKKTAVKKTGAKSAGTKSAKNKQTP